jgi:putative MATE family efflux protein
MKDLTQGKILPQLLKLALPIMGTGFMQLAYNLIDILWLGRLSGEAVAAASVAGFILWITFSIAFVAKVGAEVMIAQAIGKKQTHLLPTIGAHSLTISLIISTTLGAIILLYTDNIIALFNLSSDVSVLSKSYITIIAAMMPLWMIGPVFAGIYNGTGNSKIPFLLSCVGLGINIILDPLFIFGIGRFPAMGLQGAAIATTIAVVCETILFIVLITHKKYCPYPAFKFFVPLKTKICRDILKIGGPAALHPALFAFFTTIVARITADVGGYIGVAVQGAGSQIESLSWTTANGISTALGAYIGQNYGAKKLSRIAKSFMAGTGAITAFGLLVGSVFMIFGEDIFAVIVPSDAGIISEGARYLFILGISQMFLCMEIASSGAFNGLGKSYIPASITIVCNALRIPFALLFSHWWGIAGVWWAICASTVVKGAILGSAFPLYLRHLRKKWTIFNGQFSMDNG